MDERYDYREAVKEDVKQYIEDNYKESDIKAYRDLDDFRDDLTSGCWSSDSVTGSPSGSYYCNTWRAEEALCHNWDLLAEACEEFGGNAGDWFEKGAEYCDVSIRCYVLYEAIDEALDELGIDEDYFSDEDKDEEEEEEDPRPMTDEEQDALLLRVFS